MAELDLIPPDYRHRHLVIRWLWRFGAIYVGGLLMVLGLYLVAVDRISDESLAIEQLRLDKNELLRRQNRISQLRSQRERLQENVEMLRSMRSGPSTDAIFAAVDRALAQDVRFDAWRFSHAEPNVDGGRSSSTAEWRQSLHMEISGNAANHSALADFVKRLSSQGLVQEVRIITTRATPATSSANGPVVNFQLAVLLSSETPA